MGGKDELRAEVERLKTDLDEARAWIADLRDAGQELVDIVEGHVRDGDRLDSFTTQPMRRALQERDKG